MNKVIAICGKVGSGKTYYARQMMQEQNAVLLSNDELLHDLLFDALLAVLVSHG